MAYSLHNFLKLELHSRNLLRNVNIITKTKDTVGVKSQGLAEKDCDIFVMDN